MFFLVMAGLATAMAAYKARPAVAVWTSPHSALPDLGSVVGSAASVEGTATPLDGVLEAPLSGEECLAYQYEVEKRVSTSGMGAGRTWDTIAGGSEGVPFRLRDDGTEVLVDPTGGPLDREGPSMEYCDPVRFDVRGTEPEPVPVKQFLADREHLLDDDATVDPETEGVAIDSRRRYTEYALGPGDEAFVHGVVEERTDPRGSGDRIVLSAGPNSSWSVIADGTREAVLRRMLRSPLLILAAAVVLALVGWWI